MHVLSPAIGVPGTATCGHSLLPSGFPLVPFLTSTFSKIHSNKPGTECGPSIYWMPTVCQGHTKPRMPSQECQAKDGGTCWEQTDYVSALENLTAPSYGVRVTSAMEEGVSGIQETVALTQHLVKAVTSTGPRCLHASSWLQGPADFSGAPLSPVSFDCCSQEPALQPGTRIEREGEAASLPPAAS